MLGRDFLELLFFELFLYNGGGGGRPREQKGLVVFPALARRGPRRRGRPAPRQLLLLFLPAHAGD